MFAQGKRERSRAFGCRYRPIASEATRLTLQSSLCAIAFAITLRAQASLEYAAKSAGDTLANTAAGMRVGVCAIDSALVSCVHRQYPVPFYAALVVICFLVGRLMYPKRRA